MLNEFVYNEVHQALLEISGLPDDPDWLVSAMTAVDRALMRQNILPMDYRYRFQTVGTLSVKIFNKFTNELVLIVDM